MFKIVETLTSKQIHSLFLMHYGTDEYNKQDRVYGYQFAGACIHSDGR